MSEATALVMATASVPDFSLDRHDLRIEETKLHRMCRQVLHRLGPLGTPIRAGLMPAGKPSKLSS